MTAQTITPGIPEPKECGPFLIATRAGKPLFISHHRESDSAAVSWSDIEMNDCSWRTIVRDECGYTIEALADRDREKSAKAWEEGFQQGVLDCASHLSLGEEAVNLRINPYAKTEEHAS